MYNFKVIATELTDRIEYLFNSSTLFAEETVSYDDFVKFVTTKFYPLLEEEMEGVNEVETVNSNVNSCLTPDIRTKTTVMLRKYYTSVNELIDTNVRTHVESFIHKKFSDMDNVCKQILIDSIVHHMIDENTCFMNEDDNYCTKYSNNLIITDEMRLKLYRSIVFSKTFNILEKSGMFNDTMKKNYKNFYTTTV